MNNHTSSVLKRAPLARFEVANLNSGGTESESQYRSIEPTTGEQCHSNPRDEVKNLGLPEILQSPRLFQDDDHASPELYRPGSTIPVRTIPVRTIPVRTIPTSVTPNNAASGLSNALRGFSSLVVGMAFVLLFALVPHVTGQGVQCDPTKVMTSDACATCHTNEVQVWKQTPHFKTFQELSRRPRAKEICKKMGLRSVKRSEVCIQCHFTVKENNGKNRAVSGISCESCHGPSMDWLTEHNDYGGPTATKESESASHKQQRLESCEAIGMRNTRDFYSIASSCFNCHTVPNEELVNVGGHLAGTSDFELVSWSQGMIRHNFMRGNNTKNVESTPEKLRLLYVVGLIADLEYSTRATANATSKSSYGLTVAKRAAAKAVQLYEIQQKLADPDIEQVLNAFASAELKINNNQQLNSIANQIRTLGKKFAKENNGTKLAAVDKFLPDPSQFKWKSDR